jgi:hypothetical protein
MGAWVCCGREGKEPPNDNDKKAIVKQVTGKDETARDCTPVDLMLGTKVMPWRAPNHSLFSAQEVNKLEYSCARVEAIVLERGRATTHTE